MNRKGVTILELLISISLIGIVVLLLLRVMFSLDTINNDKTYASNDEIDRITIIKEIEQDFLELKLRGVEYKTLSDSLDITFIFDELEEHLKVYEDKLIYKDTTYNLKSEKAKYDLCFLYSYDDLGDYYLVSLNIPVLIEKVNTTKNDDITLTYLNLKSEKDSYAPNYSCLKDD